MGLGYGYDSTDSQGNTLLHRVYEKYSEYLHSKIELLVEDFLNSG